MSLRFHGSNWVLHGRKLESRDMSQINTTASTHLSAANKQAGGAATASSARSPVRASTTEALICILRKVILGEARGAHELGSGQRGLTDEVFEGKGMDRL